MKYLPFFFGPPLFLNHEKEQLDNQNLAIQSANSENGASMNGAMTYRFFFQDASI